MGDVKSHLRTKFILKRKKFFNSRISFPYNNVLNLIKKNFKKNNISIGGYFPINFEANILNFLLKLYKGKIKVGLPVIRQNYKMIFKIWEPDQAMYLNKYGIAEPKKSNKSFKPDVIFVPLVAFDKKLNRLGYGAGYYDRALKELSSKKKILAIGVGFSFQKCKNIPVKKTDYSLDYVLTEKKIFYKNN